MEFSLHQTKIAGSLHEDQYTFSIISRLVILRMKNVSDASCTENRKTRVMFNNFFFNLSDYVIT